MTNQVTIVGSIQSEFTYEHSIYGENYYRVTVSVNRTSGIADDIPVMVSDRLINVRETRLNKYVYILGQFRSHKSNGKLLLFVFATDFMEVEQPDNVNDVFMEGVIIKPPIYRVTPLGREIADMTLRVHRGYNKDDIIPCICWGRTAKYMSTFDAGSSIRVAGRIQSREYNKNGETRVAYELSVNLLEEC